MGSFGCRRDLRDARDYLWLPSADDIAKLPAQVNLSQFMPPVMEQGAIGSCTAQAVTEALRFIIKKSGNEDRSLARLQLYYDSRELEGTAKVDGGATLRDAIKCTRNSGVAHEFLWPYNPGRVLTRPPLSVYADAEKFEAITYQRVTVNATHVKVALATGYPVLIGLTLYESFQSAEVARTGIVPMPDLDQESVAGGHAILAYGYGDHPGHFTIRNSWGVQWGNKGDCYIPEDYVGSTKYGADFWRITRTS